MKIAFLTDTYEPEINGVVTSISNFAERLAAHGHEILIIAPKYNKEHGESLGSIKVKRYPSFSYAANKNTRIAYPFLINIMKDLRDFAPDIVHVQTPMNIGVTGLMAARLLRMRTIQTYHTYIPDFMIYVSPYRVLETSIDKVAGNIAVLMRARKLIEADFSEIEKFEDVAAQMNRRTAFMKMVRRFSRRFQSGGNLDLTEKLAWDFSRVIYNRSELVITPSKSLAVVLRKHRIKPPIIDVSNGIDFAAFDKKADYGITQRLVSVGRLGVEGKNVDIVIKAFALALEKRPGMLLDIAGDGPARESLERLVDRLGIRANVNFLGFISQDELKKGYREHDAFVTASTIETQGLVVIEAMAAGLPIIGVNALAIPECVKNNQNGYLLKPGDVGAMAEAMIGLTESPERNRKFGERSLEISREHDLSICVEKLESVYRKLIES